MEFYNSVVARNPKLEMIFHSWDKDPAAMSTFVSKYGIRFPMFRHGVMKTKAGRDKMPTVAPHIQQKLPFVIMLDGKGEVVADEDTNLDAVKRFLAKQGE